MDLENKVALITGGARGLGFAFGKELLRNGVEHLAIVDLGTSVGEESAKELNAEFGQGRVIFIPCDVTNEKEFEAGFIKTVEEFGQLDIVINNAGILDDRRFELMININFTAVVRGTILGIQYMGKHTNNKGGVIVNMSSIFGLDPVASASVYDGTKHAVVGFTRSLAMPCHYKKTGVRLLTICPGFTETPLLVENPNYYMDFIDEEVAADAVKGCPFQKVDVVAQGMLHIIRSAKPGTVWVAEGGEPIYEVLIPDRLAMKAPINNVPE